LFGVTYRYAVRKDSNIHLKQGVVGAFAITRAINLVDVSSICSQTFPLECGQPFHIFTGFMFLTGFLFFLESISAFGGAAYGIEKLFAQNLLSKFPSE
jgi:hypothetical protein